MSHNNKYDLSGGWLDLFLIFLGPVVISIPLEFLISLFNSLQKDYQIMLNTLMRTLLLLLFFYLIAIRRNHLSWRDFGLKKRNLLRHFLRGVLAGILIVFIILIVNVFFMSIVTSFTRLRPEVQTVTRIVLELEWGFPLMIMVAVVVFLAPFFEELCFRALIYPFLRSRWGDLKAVVGSSLLFGLAHGNPWAILPAFCGGMGLVLLYRKYKNLWVPIFAHSTWNGIMIFFLLLFKKYGN